MEDKQVKQHDYVTSSRSDEGLHHLNTSKTFNSVRTTVHYTLVIMLRVKERKGLRGGKVIYMASM